MTEWCTTLSIAGAALGIGVKEQHGSGLRQGPGEVGGTEGLGPRHYA